jgi:hypothetical protein
MAKPISINDTGFDFFAGMQDDKGEDQEPEEPKKRGRPPKVKVPKSPRVSKAVAAAKVAESKMDMQALTDEEQERVKLLTILNRYASNQRFGEWLKNNGFKMLFSSTLHKKKNPELLDLLKQVRFSLNNRTNDTMIDTMVKGGLETMETLTTKLSKNKIDLTGMTMELYGNEEWVDTLELLKLEYLNFSTMDPKLKFALITAKVGLGVAAKNKVKQMRRELSEQPQQPQEAEQQQLQPSTSKQQDDGISVPKFE